MINELGPDIVDIGYLVCAIAPGKKYPMGKAWGEHPLTADECRNFKPSDAGVGIICGKGQIPVYGLDFDIPGDPNFAIEIRKAVAKCLRCDDLLYRVGQPPKFLVPVQGEVGLQAYFPIFRKERFPSSTRSAWGRPAICCRGGPP